jgi:pimeloyl-ACP methyl ester carboxylesterase
VENSLRFAHIHLLTVLLAVGLASAKLSLAQAVCSSIVSDTTFSGGSEIDITRVVGSGTPVNMNSDGTLKSWQTDVFNQVVSATAGLGLQMIYEDSSPAKFWGTVSVTINGKLEGVHSVDNQHVCVPISTQLLRFAQRGLLQGASPIPGKNSISVTFNPSACTAPNGVYLPLTNCSQFSISTLTFQAMAPIVMIHGIRADYNWFTANNFTVPFQQNDLPYDILHFPATVSIQDGGRNIGPLIQQIANEFGSQHVHIIAHSKGGLWTREFLTRWAHGLKIGVYSIHTLDTPQHGSSGADIAVAARRVFPGGSAFAFLADDPAVQDLMVESVARYNAQASSLPQVSWVTYPAGTKENLVQYFSYQGDANLGGATDANGFGKIDCSQDPCDGWSGYWWNSTIPQTLYSTMQRVSLVSVVTDPSGHTHAIEYTNPGPPYVGNDFIVTVQSAQFQPTNSVGFQPLTTWHVNHSTIGYSQVTPSIR